MGTGFHDLEVWQEAKALAVEIYRITARLQDFGLRDQLPPAAVSVPSNIAEGDERDTNRDSVRFLYIAKGSLAELRTHTKGLYVLDDWEGRDVSPRRPRTARRAVPTGASRHNPNVMDYWYQLEIARDIGSVSPTLYTELEGKCAEIGRMLGALIKARADHP